MTCFDGKLMYADACEGKGGKAGRGETGRMGRDSGREEGRGWEERGGEKGKKIEAGREIGESHFGRKADSRATALAAGLQQLHL